MKYHQIMVEVAKQKLEEAEAICHMVVPYGFWTEDYSDIEEYSSYVPGRLIDEELMEKDKTIAKIHIFITEEINPSEALTFLEERLTLAHIPYEISTSSVDEEDYAHAWKKHYKPLRVGKRIMIVPSWEAYVPKPDDIVIELDPGMAFGTGDHETTKLCLSLLEDTLKSGDRLLDVGCGSGILSIAGVKLGAESAVGTDIDPVAVKVAKENAVLGDVSDQVTYLETDLTGDIEGKFNVITANIVASIIIMLTKDVTRFLAKDGVFITSGIIEERSEEVCEALLQAGFEITEKREDRGWVAYAARLKEEA